MVRKNYREYEEFLRKLIEVNDAKEKIIELKAGQFYNLGIKFITRWNTNC